MAGISDAATSGLEGQGQPIAREDVTFASGKDDCAAWHYIPESVAGPCPCIVMAHGFGGTRDTGLAPFAERFVAAGYHVLVFDYRSFGDSGGEPRQVISIGRQLADWQAAIDFARTLEGVDPDRIALWGSSFSGGHVLVAAVRDGRVAAVSSQVPMMDGYAAIKNMRGSLGLARQLRFTARALADAFRGLLGISPLMVPIVGPPGTLAVMTAPDAEQGLMAIAPPDFRNEVAARIGLAVPSYRPFKYADRLPCPILIQASIGDSVAPDEAASAAAERAGGKARLERYPIGHFDIYVSPARERAVSDQLEFFSQHLSAS